MMTVSDAPPQTRERFIIDAARARALVEACGGTLSQHDAAAGYAPPQAAAIGTLVLGVQPVLTTLMQAQQLHQSQAIMHRQEHMRWHRPLKLACPYTVAAVPLRHEVRRAGTFLQVGVNIAHADEGLVLSSVSHLFVPPEGLHVRAPAPPSALLEPAAADSATEPTSPSVAVLPTWQVPDDGPERYAQASLETNPIHLDDHKAQAAGLPKRVLHGMCTLGFAAQALGAHLFGDLSGANLGASRTITALSARFAHPVFCRDVLTCRVRAMSTTPQMTEVLFDVVQQRGIVVLSRGSVRYAQHSLIAQRRGGGASASAALG